MLLWSVKAWEQDLLVARGLEGVVELAGDVALEAADDLGLGQAFGGAPGGVGAGAWVVAQASEDDHVEGVVGGAIAAAVEAVAVGPSAASGDGGHAAQVRERCLGVQPLGVVPERGQELAGDFGADAGQCDQARSGRGHQRAEFDVSFADLLAEVLVAASVDRPDRKAGDIADPETATKTALRRLARRRAAVDFGYFAGQPRRPGRVRPP